MRIINTTVYSTRDLKKFFTRIAKDELDAVKANRIRFRIVYSHKGRHSGCAFVGGVSDTLRLPKPPHKVDHAQVALVIAHEMAHLRGYKHGAKMHCARYSWSHGDYHTFYAWANDLPLTVKAPTVKPAPSTSKLEKVVGKLAHAQTMLAKNEAKLKRATALVKKWQKKVKYYTKKNSPEKFSIIS